MLRSLSVRVLIALVAGLALGAAAAAFAGPEVKRGIEIFESLGGLWLNSLRMTVVPLIFAVLVTGIAGVADAAATGRLAVRTLILIVALMTFSAVFALCSQPASTPSGRWARPARRRCGPGRARRRTSPGRRPA